MPAEQKIDVCPIIRVDRSIRPNYNPDEEQIVFAVRAKARKHPLHPELELIGPVEFDVTSLLTLSFPTPEEGAADSMFVYRELCQRRLLERCIGLRDLEEIKHKGVEFFIHFIGWSKCLYGWKSIVRSGWGISIPCLHIYSADDDPEEMSLIWTQLDRKHSKYIDAQYFPESSTSP